MEVKPDKKNTSVSLLAAVIFLICGCAQSLIFQPEFKESQAEKSRQKILAILEISELGSSIKDINKVVLSKLESYLSSQFKVVDRKSIELLNIERKYKMIADIRQKIKAGKLLGADFVIYGTAVAYISGPKIRWDQQISKEGAFSGKVWDDIGAFSGLDIKVVDVQAGIISSSFSGYSRSSQDSNLMIFSDERTFNEALNSRSPYGVRRFDVDKFADLDKDFAETLSRAIDKAVQSVGRKIIKKYGLPADKY